MNRMARRAQELAQGPGGLGAAGRAYAVYAAVNLRVPAVASHLTMSFRSSVCRLQL